MPSSQHDFMIHTPDAISGFASDGSGMGVVHDVMIHRPPPLTGSASQKPGNDGVPDSDHTEGGARSEIGKAVFITPFDQLVFPMPHADHDEEEEEVFEHLDTKDFDHIVTIHDLEAVNPLACMVDSSAATYSWEIVANANAEYGPAFDPDNTTGDIRVWQLSKIVCGFVKECDAEVIDALVQKHDRDTTLAVLGDRLLDWFAERCGELINVPNAAESFTKERAFFAALEMLVLGVQHYHEPVDQCQSLCGFPMNQVFQVYDAAQEQVKTAKKIREGRLIEAAYEVYWDHRIQFLSPTEEQEDDIDLAPAHKARIFINALKERNDAGSLCTTYERDAQGTLIAIGLNYTPLLTYKKEDVNTLERLFGRYLYSSASDLLRIIDLCLRVNIETLMGDTERTKAFHAGQGRILPFFCVHLTTIVAELIDRYGIDHSRNLRDYRWGPR